jgi:hypothetical protein
VANAFNSLCRYGALGRGLGGIFLTLRVWPPVCTAYWSIICTSGSAGVMFVAVPSNHYSGRRQQFWHDLLSLLDVYLKRQFCNTTFHLSPTPSSFIVILPYSYLLETVSSCSESAPSHPFSASGTSRRPCRAPPKFGFSAISRAKFAFATQTQGALAARSRSSSWSVRWLDSG